MLKKGLSYLFLVFAIMALVACSGGDDTASNDGETEKDSSGDSGETYEIRITHTVPQSSPDHLSLEGFKEVAEEKSDGRIQVEIFDSGQLYSSEREAAEAVQAGNIEMTAAAASAVAGFESKLMVLDLPFIFPDNETAAEALDGELGQTLSDSLPEKGLRNLAYGESGMRHLTNNSHPIESPEDLKGLKIRTMENELHVESFKALGANPSPHAFGELYTALQQNVFDAQENPINLIDEMKLYEPQKYLTISNHAYTTMMLLINEELYQSMPEDLQEVLKEAAIEFRDLNRSIVRERDEKGMEIMKEHLEINELTPEQRQLFIDAAQPVYEQFEDKIGTDLLELARSYSE